MNVCQAPLGAANALVDLPAKVRAFVDAARASGQGGYTVAEVAELLAELLRLTVAALEAIPADKPAKLQFAVDAVLMLFDAIADKAVPLVAWPAWIVLRPAVRHLVQLGTAGLVRVLLRMERGQ